MPPQDHRNFPPRTLDWSGEIPDAKESRKRVQGGGIYARQGADHYPDLP